MFTVVLFWLVVVVALAMGVAMFAAFARDLNRRVDQAQAGGRDLAGELEAMRKRQEDLLERIQNLEAIVTNEAWERKSDE